MTRPTTARLLTTKARDVKPGQYGNLWTGQYLHIYDGAQPGGGGGHSYIWPVQVCAAVKTPFFDLTRA